jgi:hypothetical protein
MATQPERLWPWTDEEIEEYVEQFLFESSTIAWGMRKLLEGADSIMLKDNVGNVLMHPEFVIMLIEWSQQHPIEEFVKNKPRK